MKKSLVLIAAFSITAHAADKELKGFVDDIPEFNWTPAGHVAPAGYELDEYNGREKLCNDFLEDEKKVNLEIESVLQEIEKVIPIDSLIADMYKNNLALKLRIEGKKEEEALLTAVSQVLIQKSPSSLHLVSKLSVALEKSRAFKEKTSTCSLVVDDYLAQGVHERTNALQKRLNEKSDDKLLIAEFNSWTAEKYEEAKKAITEGHLSDLEAIRAEIIQAARLPWEGERDSRVRKLNPPHKIHIEQSSKALLERISLLSSTPKFEIVNAFLKQISMPKIQSNN